MHRPFTRAPLSTHPLAGVLAGVFALVAALVASPVEAADGRGAAGREKVHTGGRGAAAAAGSLVRAAAARDSASEGERTRLRGELDRLNREIDALKQRRRSLGEDYALRAKMADAEAKARRLTELEGNAARAGGDRATAAGAAGGEPRPPLRLSATPLPSAGDDSEVLDAKADILADQARRVGQQADLLEHRVLSLRGRQELRRRAGELELDPFSPFEQSKRRVPIGAPTTSVGASAPTTSPPVGQATNPTLPGGGTTISSNSSAPGAKGTSTSPGATNPGSGMSAATPTTVSTSAPAQPGATSLAGPPAPGVMTGAAIAPSPSSPTSAQPQSGSRGADTSGQGIGTIAPTVNPESTTSTTQPAGTGLASGSDAAGSLAGQFRDVLDPLTLTEIRRLEGSGGAARASLPATERALAALRARARQLQSEADAARRAAHPGAGQRP